MNHVQNVMYSLCSIWNGCFEWRIQALALYECKLYTEINNERLVNFIRKFGFLISVRSTPRYIETKIDYLLLIECTTFGLSNQL